MVAVADTVRVALLVCVGFVVIAVAALAVRLPPPLGQTLTLLVAAVGAYAWYRL
jgi:hypothetical protein